ncbi:MAG TPA: universal stress protein [Arthrobacter sp.]|nr:universal stress protein [Arthrobacter sp.]
MDTPSTAGQIVVGVDGSDSSIEALRLAAGLASALGAGIHAVACWHFPYLYAGLVEASDLKPYEEEAAKGLEESLQKAFDGDRPAGLQTSVLNGPAASTLMSVAEDAKMLVLGRRGHGGFSGLQLGSVSNACAAHALCPVLVVHGDDKRHRR